MRSPTKKELEEDPLAGDLSDFISQGTWRKAHFIFAPKDTTVTIRVPSHLLEIAKKVAKKKGVKYHRLMRDAIADYVFKESQS